MKKPIALVVADTHLKYSNIDQFKHYFKGLEEYIKTNGIKFMVHCGDFFDSRNSLHFEVMQTAVWFENWVSNMGITCLICPGNHDKYNYNNIESYVDLFKLSRNIKVFDQYGFFAAQYGYKSYIFHFLPYSEGEAFESDVSEIIESGKDGLFEGVLFAHVNFTGAVKRDGVKIGEDHPNSINPKELSELFHLVLSGHFHEPDSLAHNVHYIGATFQHQFGDSRLRGFGVLYEDYTFDYALKTPYHEEYIQEYQQYRFTDPKEVFYQDPFSTFKLKEGDNLRFVLNMSPEDLLLVDTARLKELGVQVTLDPLYSVHSQNKDVLDSFSRSKGKIVREAFKSWCEASDYGDRIKKLTKKYYIDERIEEHA